MMFFIKTDEPSPCLPCLRAPQKDDGVNAGLRKKTIDILLFVWHYLVNNAVLFDGGFCCGKICAFKLGSMESKK